MATPAIEQAFQRMEEIEREVDALDPTADADRIESLWIEWDAIMLWLEI